MASGFTIAWARTWTRTGDGTPPSHAHAPVCRRGRFDGSPLVAVGFSPAIASSAPGDGVPRRATRSHRAFVVHLLEAAAAARPAVSRALGSVPGFLALLPVFEPGGEREAQGRPTHPGRGEGLGRLRRTAPHGRDQGRHLG